MENQRNCREGWSKPTDLDVNFEVISIWMTHISEIKASRTKTIHSHWVKKKKQLNIGFRDDPLLSYLSPSVSKESANVADWLKNEYYIKLKLNIMDSKYHVGNTAKKVQHPSTGNTNSIIGYFYLHITSTKNFLNKYYKKNLQTNQHPSYGDIHCG